MKTYCIKCGQEFNGINNSQKFCCKSCRLEYTKGACKWRFSGKYYKNTEEKLASLKEKYKNGVTKEILKEFFETL